MKCLVDSLTVKNEKNQEEISCLTLHSRCLEEEKQQLQKIAADLYALTDEHKQVVCENEEITKQIVGLKYMLADYQTREDQYRQTIVGTRAKNKELIETLNKLSAISTQVNGRQKVKNASSRQIQSSFIKKWGMRRNNDANNLSSANEVHGNATLSIHSKNEALNKNASQEDNININRIDSYVHSLFPQISSPNILFQTVEKKPNPEHKHNITQHLSLRDINAQKGLSIPKIQRHSFSQITNIAHQFQGRNQPNDHDDMEEVNFGQESNY